jgi:hypothetical protein
LLEILQFTQMGIIRALSRNRRKPRSQQYGTQTRMLNLYKRILDLLEED